MNSLTIVTVLMAIAFLGGAAAEDVIHLKQRDPLEGEILVLDEEKVTLKMVTELAPGQFGSRTVNIPIAAIDYIEFTSLPNEEAILADPAGADTAQLEALWDAKRKYLTTPRSNAGLAALAFADRLLEAERELQSRQAKEIYAKVEADDWNPDHQRQATQGRLRAMIALGELMEAIQEAGEIAEKTEDPKMLIEAKFVLAVAEFDQLQAIEEEHPKWMEDDEVRPERNAHYHDALDLFLFPYLFHGSAEEGSARGLWHAAEVYQYTGDSMNASRCAEDIVRLYPNTTYLSRAQALLSKPATP